MTTAKERYYELKKQTDKCFEGVHDPIHDYVIELEQELHDSELRRKDLLMSLHTAKAQKRKLEQEKAELVEFVRDIAYNDINKNDLDIDWVQKESWELLNKHTDKPDAL